MCPGVFPTNLKRKREPTSGLGPLTCSRYELACGYPNVYCHVSVRGLFKSNSQPRWLRPSYFVPSRTSPVAVKSPYGVAKLLVLAVTHEYIAKLLDIGSDQERLLQNQAQDGRLGQEVGSRNPRVELEPVELRHHFRRRVPPTVWFGDTRNSTRFKLAAARRRTRIRPHKLLVVRQ